MRSGRQILAPLYMYLSGSSASAQDARALYRELRTGVLNVLYNYRNYRCISEITGVISDLNPFNWPIRLQYFIEVYSISRC